jgi:RNA polymerase sigma-70 factor (ECF subfamily)
MARTRRPKAVETEAEEFSVLFRRHYGQIVTFARRRVGPDASQEIAAETFLIAWRRFSSVPEPALPWLYQVATFTIANHRRREAKSVPTGVGTLDGLVSSAMGEDQTGSDSLIREAFLALGEKDQEILRLAAWEGLSSTDGASVLGCSVTAYRVRLHRARARLSKDFIARPAPPAVTRSTGAVATSSAERPGLLRAGEESA